ncbi:MAG: Ribonuclease R [Chlamydiae bacterium]|nr:Ribonuclease R [Chlamydiota bacterium]
MTQKKNYFGIFKAHRLGYGFVKSLNGEYSPDIFIPKSATAHAIEGDLVEVEITGTESKKGWEGKILLVSERKHHLVAGIVMQLFSKKALLYCPLLGLSKEVEISIEPPHKFKIGDRLEVELQKTVPNKDTVKAQFKSYIGNIKDPSCDIAAAVSEFALREDFPREVQRDLKKFPKKIIPKDYPDRDDFQKLVCFTIDPDTAKDFDDAISLEKSPQGHWILGVHIADVSHFVVEGSPLDLEASRRCNSTYFPGRCVPMLPSELSDNLCSLKPKVPRLAISTFMTLDDEGNLLSAKSSRSIIKSKHRYTYKEVKAILDGKVKSRDAKKLNELKEVACTLKALRKKRGCLDLALSDTQILVDQQGIPQGIEVIEYDITHQMIEEFMLKNNEVIAKLMSDREVSIPYRIHESPKPDNLREFVQMADTLGFKLSMPPLQSELQELFEEISGSEREHQVTVAFIRCMKLAIYSSENAGHYGLQLDYYCHFTSPIRRYMDLVVHRKLFDQSELQDCKIICERASDTERLSAKAENSVRTLKILRYLLAKQKKPTPIYTAIVTKVKPFGLIFELPEILLEGFLHISKLGRDYYVFNDRKGRIEGENTKDSLFVGKKINVKINSICLMTQEADWKRVH